MEAAERAGAMVTEQIRAITEAAEQQAGDLRREAEADAESLERDGREAVRGVLERIDQLEAAVRQLIGSLRHEADALSRLVGRGQSPRSDRPSRSAPPAEPLALQPGSAPAEASTPEAPLDEVEIAPPAPEEPVRIDESREDELSVDAEPLDAAMAPEPEVFAGAGEPLEAEAPEHPPTVDPAEPALEEEQLSDLEAPEPEPLLETEPPPEELVEREPIEGSELGSIEDPHAEVEDDVEVVSRDDAAPAEAKGGIDDASARPREHRRRGLRSLFRRRARGSSGDEQSSEELPSSEEAFGVEEGSAANVSEDLGPAIEEPRPADDEELGVSSPLVVQEGWWEEEGEDETPTGEPPPDGGTDAVEETDAPRDDPGSQAVAGPHEDAFDAPHGGGDPLEETVEETPPSETSADERDAKVGVLLGGIRPSRPPAPRCVACNRVHEESFKGAEAEGWYVDGPEALCERCQAAGWRVQQEDDQPKRGGRG